MTVIEPTKLGVNKVAFVERTLDPDPVDVVTPVPPFRTGRAVPEYVIAKVPDEVIVDGATVKNEGTVTPIDVTVPGPEICRSQVPLGLGLVRQTTVAIPFGGIVPTVPEVK